MEEEEEEESRGERPLLQRFQTPPEWKLLEKEAGGEPRRAYREGALASTNCECSMDSESVRVRRPSSGRCGWWLIAWRIAHVGDISVAVAGARIISPVRPPPDTSIQRQNEGERASKFIWDGLGVNGNICISFSKFKRSLQHN